MRIIQRFSVAFEYPVYFTRDLFDPSNPILADAVARHEPDRRHRMFVVIDDGVADAHGRIGEAIVEYVDAYRDMLELAAAPYVVPGGEAGKNEASIVDQILERVRARSLDRQAAVVVVGGGAVQDVVGYAASVAHRGLRIVRVPTTVASQNDSGVGVKTGLNRFGIKNFVGTFYPPFAVIDDFSFLSTLTDRDRRAGMAEAVKVALIRSADFFDWLEDNAQALAEFEPSAVETMIRRSAELHLEHIATSGDPFEFRSAKPLDYGHWLAHRIESLTDYSLRHGEAVAIGIAADARYAVHIGLLDERDLLRICSLLARLGLSLWHPILAKCDSDGRALILEGLREFREHLGGDLSITMLEGIGRAKEVTTIDETEVLRAISWLSERTRSAA